MLPGVYAAEKKDKTIYYRSNITFSGKHISLGSFDTEEKAHLAYKEAEALLYGKTSLEELLVAPEDHLSFDKKITLMNFRDNHMYIGNPIYLHKNYFSYFFSPNEELKFDIDDLFYYSSHKIMRRKGHLFVNDYGLQTSILSRYGIKAHAVSGRDYEFVNGDTSDFRYSNIKVINPYYGVSQIEKKGQIKYRTKIHIEGNYTIGTYSSETKAAIAYNKAVDLAKAAGIHKNFPENYIDSIPAKEYAEIYTKVRISNKYLEYLSTI